MLVDGHSINGSCFDCLCRNGEEFDPNHVTFNAGVYGVNFDLWRESHVHSEVSYWMNQVIHTDTHTHVCMNAHTHTHAHTYNLPLQQAKTPLWQYGTQPIMLLVTYGRWSQLDSHWNVNGEPS